MFFIFLLLHLVELILYWKRLSETLLKGKYALLSLGSFDKRDMIVFVPI